MLRNSPFTLVLILMIFAFNEVSAQHKPSILLSNHTYSSSNTMVGKITLEGTDAKFKLSGKNANLFKIRNGELSINKKYINGEPKWYDLTIIAESSSGSFQETFRLVKDDFKRNSVIAHRGAWKNTGASENSIASLQHAVSLGCHGSEFDVHMTSDSVLIVNHDPSFQEKFIYKTASSELLQLKLSNGESLPTLQSYLEEGLKQNTTKLVLELKPTINKERAIQSAHKVYEMVKSMKAQAWIDYISFDYDICLELMRLDPYARVAYLNGDKSPELLAADKFWGFDYNQSIFQKNPTWIQQAKNKNLTTNVWTVNDAKMLQWFIEQKLDFITTNEPELLLNMISK